LRSPEKWGQGRENGKKRKRRKGKNSSRGKKRYRKAERKNQ